MKTLKPLWRQVIHMDQSVATLTAEMYDLQRRYGETAGSPYGPVMVERRSMLKRYNDIRHSLAVKHSLILPDIESW